MSDVERTYGEACRSLDAALRSLTEFVTGYPDPCELRIRFVINDLFYGWIAVVEP